MGSLTIFVELYFSLYLCMEKNTLYEELLMLPSVEVLGIEIESNTITIACQVKNPSDTCPNCVQICTTINQYYYRKIRDRDMGVRQVYLSVKMRQFYCKKCNRYFTETLDFADLNKEHTHRQSDYIFCLARKQPLTEVAAIVNISAKTVERIVLDACRKTVNIPERYRQVRRLGIDEHSHRKGKKEYLCILTDLDRGIIVDMLPNRRKETLIAHFQSLGSEFCNQITDVACDYWDAYITTAKTVFPKAKIILDRFHVTKLLNNVLDNFRKELRKSDTLNKNYRRLKWILYKQYHRLSDQQIDELEAAFLDSPFLEELYKIRENFHHILDNTSTVSEASKAIDNWIESISEKGIKNFDGFIKTLNNTKEYVANYVENYLSNAVTEGLNNLIRSVRRTAFGMTNFENLRWRVLAISS
jgi:transposase